MNKIILYPFAALLIIASSIALHEAVHIIQLSGQHIDEVCLLGYKETESVQALGWVKAGLKTSYHAASMESEASLIQMLYVATATFLFIWKTKEARKDYTINAS
ncbi:MAG: hypothetical protein HYX24_02780 [Candidatus Aenigmarchaeota archaeon]|nr:hypothetical protein [Candidatus Aenigmarchaeota archaeon]